MHKKLLEAAGIEHEVLASGCCGMVGAFVFNVAKYDVSLAAGGRVLLPAVQQMFVARV